MTSNNVLTDTQAKLCAFKASFSALAVAFTTFLARALDQQVTDL